MDDLQIALMIVNCDCREHFELGMNLFKQLGYSKNRIKRLIIKTIKRMMNDGKEFTWDDMISHIAYSNLPNSQHHIRPFRNSFELILFK